MTGCLPCTFCAPITISALQSMFDPDPIIGTKYGQNQEDSSTFTFDVDVGKARSLEEEEVIKVKEGKV